MLRDIISRYPSALRIDVLWVVALYTLSNYHLDGVLVVVKPQESCQAIQWILIAIVAHPMQ